MIELFKRVTWSQFQSDTSGQYDDCKVLYITDKDIHRIKYGEGNNSKYVMYSEAYGRCDFSYEQALQIQNELSPGMYIFNNDDLYYYTGNNWIKVGTAGNGENPQASSFTIWSQHTEYGAEGYDKVSDDGNLQIKGFVEGQISGGGW